MVEGISSEIDKDKIDGQALAGRGCQPHYDPWKASFECEDLQVRKAVVFDYQGPN